MNSDLFDAGIMALHIIAAAVFVGPQVLLAAAMPSVRSMEDAHARQQFTHSLTRWFGILGGSALVVLLATGVWNLTGVDENNTFFETRQRYFIVMQVKLTLVTIVVTLTAAHGMFLGRRLQQLQEAGASEVEIAKARRWSMLTSMLTLATSLAILVCAGLLSATWSQLGAHR